MLDDYLDANEIIVRDTKHSSDAKKYRASLTENDMEQESEEIIKKRHKPLERLGFGFLSMFRTMRYLVIVTGCMALIMFIVGIQYFKASPYFLPGFSASDLFSMSNLDFSESICIQQYI